MNKTYEVHVPVEQYGFVSCTLEGSAEDAIDEYNQIKHAIGFGDGMKESEYRKIYDKVAMGEEINGDPGMLDQMNAVQRFSLMEAKRFLKRKAGIKNTMNNYKNHE